MSFVFTKSSVAPLFDWLNTIDEAGILPNAPRMKKELDGIVGREMRTQTAALYALECIAGRWQEDLLSAGFDDNGLSGIIMEIRNQMPPGTSSCACPMEGDGGGSAASACAFSSMYRPSPLREMTYQGQAAASASAVSIDSLVSKREQSHLKREIEQTELEISGLVLAVSRGRGGDVFKRKLESRYIYLNCLKALQSQRACSQRRVAPSPALQEVPPCGLLHQVEGSDSRLDVPPLYLDAEEGGIVPSSSRLPELKGGSSSSAASSSVVREEPRERDPLRAVTLLEPSSQNQGKILDMVLSIEIEAAQNEIQALNQFIVTCEDPETYRLRVANRTLYLESLLKLIVRERT